MFFGGGGGRGRGRGPGEKMRGRDTVHQMKVRKNRSTLCIFLDFGNVSTADLFISTQSRNDLKCIAKNKPNIAAKHSWPSSAMQGNTVFFSAGQEYLAEIFGSRIKEKMTLLSLLVLIFAIEFFVRTTISII